MSHLFSMSQELQKGIDQRKAIVLSVNLCSAEFLKPCVEAATPQEVAEQGAEEIQARLKDMNDRWDRLGEGLSAWRDALQEALMQCQVCGYMLKLPRVKPVKSGSNCGCSSIWIILVQTGTHCFKPVELVQTV